MRGDTGAITLSAGGTHRIDAGLSNYLYAYTLEGLVSVQLRLGKKPIENEHAMEGRTLLKGRTFDEVIIVNTSGADNDIRFFFGPGDYQPPNDQALVTIDDSSPVDVAIASGSVTLNSDQITDGITSVADVSCAATSTTPVVTASASNARVRVSNPIDSGEVLRVGLHSGVGAANGTPVGPGSTWETQSVLGVWVYNPGSGAILVPVEVETAS